MSSLIARKSKHNDNQDPRWEPEPRIGTVRNGADGSKWRKVQTLGGEEWGRALCHAISAVRVGQAPSCEDIEAMGYERAILPTPNSDALETR